MIETNHKRKVSFCSEYKPYFQKQSAKELKMTRRSL
jgi:hypothetical protein